MWGFILGFVLGVWAKHFIDKWNAKKKAAAGGSVDAPKSTGEKW